MTARNMNRWIVSAALWSLVVSGAAAQSLRGAVRADDGEPLPGATVRLAEQDRGTAAGADGTFRLEGLTPGEATLEIRFLGYEPYVEKVTLRPDEELVREVRLRPVATRLRDVIVSERAAQARLTERAQSAAALSAMDVARSRGQTLGETLEQLPGVTILSTGPSIAKPVVRGLHSERVIVLNAGVPQEGQQWGGEHGPEIDPFAPARIELVRGVAGVEYGVGAIGGVIRVEPRELPVEPGVGGELQVNAFSNNRQGAGSLLLEGATDRVRGLGWRVQGSLRRAGDARAPAYGLVNSGFFERNVLVATGLHRAQFGLDVQASRFETELGIFQGAHIGGAEDLRLIIENGEPFVTGPFSYRIEAPKQRITHDLLSVRTHLNSSAGDRLEVRYGLQRNHRQEFDRHYRGQTLPEGRLAFDLSLVSQTLEARWQHRPLGRFVGSVGVSGMNQRNTNGEAGQLIPNFRALTGGVFAREAYVRGPVTLEAGARYDYRHLQAYPRVEGTYQRTVSTYGAFTLATSALWQFRRDWSVGASLGSAWRPPSVNELYAFGVHHGTAQFEVGDASLGRERSLGADLTLRHEGRLVQLEASAYTNRFDGYLFLFPDTTFVTTFRGVFPRYQYRQTDAVLRGVDGQIVVRPARFLSFETTFALVRANDTAHDVPLYGMPSDRASLAATWHLPRLPYLHRAEFTAGARFVRRQDRVPSGADFVPPPPGYQLFDLGLSGTLRVAATPVTFSLGVENVFDTAYRDYLSRFRYFSDNPGRNVSLRIRIPFGQQPG